MFSLPLLAITVSFICTACQETYSQGHVLDYSFIDIQLYLHLTSMDSVTCTPFIQVPQCSKCGRPRKGHPLPYGNNCVLTLTGESANDSRHTLSCSEEALEVPHLHSQSVPGKPEDLVAEPSALKPSQTGSRDPGPNSTSDYSITSHHYNNHHHRGIDGMCPSSVVHQAWSAGQREG